MTKLGTDITIAPFFTAHDASELDFVRQRTTVRSGNRATPPRFDVGSVSGRENLAQALLLQLLTPRGALAGLGHARYGSRLHELIGRNKTQELRYLCRAYVLEVVAQEPRVENQAVEIVFDPLAETLSSFVFTLVVQPVAGDDPLSLTLEIDL
jgi:phage baseplate assembly protein W